MLRLMHACAQLLLLAVLPALAQSQAELPPQSVEAFREQVAAVLKSAPGAPSAGIVLIENGDVARQGSVGVAGPAPGRPPMMARITASVRSPRCSWRWPCCSRSIGLLGIQLWAW